MKNLAPWVFEKLLIVISVIFFLEPLFALSLSYCLIYSNIVFWFMSVISSISIVQAQTVAVADPSSSLHGPDIFSNDLVMSKVLRYVDAGKTVAAISLASKRFKKLMDVEKDMRVDRLKKEACFLKEAHSLMSTKELSFGFDAWTEQTRAESVRGMQEKIDAVCDELCVERFSIFNEIRVSNFLGITDAVDVCYKFQSCWFEKMNIDGFSFNPGKLFSKEDKRNLSLSDDVEAKKIARAPKGALEKLYKVKELIQEFDDVKRVCCSLYAYFSQVNCFFRTIDWLKTNDVISAEVFRDANALIREEAFKHIDEGILDDLASDYEFASLNLRDIGVDLKEFFSSRLSGLPRAITVTAISENIDSLCLDERLEKKRDRKIMNHFPGFREHCKKTCVLKASEEVEFVKTAKKILAWLGAARNLGVEIWWL